VAADKIIIVKQAKDGEPRCSSVPKITRKRKKERTKKRTELLGRQRERERDEEIRGREVA